MHFIVNNIGKIAITLLLLTLLYLGLSISSLKHQNNLRVSDISTLSTRVTEVKGIITKVDTSRKANEISLLRDLAIINIQVTNIGEQVVLHKTVLQKEVVRNRRLERKINACLKRCEE